MKTRNIIAILAALPIVAGLTGCKSDEELDAKPAKEILIVGDGSIEYRANEEGTEVPVTADCHWTVSYDQGNFDGELTVQPSQGNGNGTLIIRSDQNTMPNTNREATITLTSDGGLKQRITVRQTSGDPSLNISHDEFNFEAADIQPQLLTISSNGNWRLQKASDVNWFHVTDADGNEITEGAAGATAVYVSVERAVNDVNRSARFAVQYNNKSAEVTVNQTGMTNITLRVPETAVDFGIQGGERELSVECNAEWHAYVPSTIDWLHVEAPDSIGNGMIRIFCEPNPSTADRLTGIVIISGSKTPHQSIVLVEQAGSGAQPADYTWVGDLHSIYVSVTTAEFLFNYQSDQVVGTYGIVYSATNSTPARNDGSSIDIPLGSGNTSGSALASLRDLTPNTTYYVRAYVEANTQGQGTVYSNTEVFTTEHYYASVGDISVLYVSHEAADLSFSFNADTSVDEYGVVYSTSNSYPAVGSADCETVLVGSGGSQNSVIAHLTGLQPNTTYYVRPFVRAHIYGSDLTLVYGYPYQFTTSRTPGPDDNPNPNPAPKR